MRQQRMLLLWLSFVFVAFGAFGQTIQFLDENNQPLTAARQFSSVWVQVTDSASAGAGSLLVDVSSDLRGSHLSGPFPESPANSGIFRSLIFLYPMQPSDPSSAFGLPITEDPGPPHRFDTVRVTVPCQTPPCAEASIPTWASALRFLDDQGNPLSRIPAGATIFIEGRDNSNAAFTVTLTAQPGGDTETVNLRYAGGYPADIFFRNTIPIPTTSGPAAPGDGVLQIEEGGTLTATHNNYLGLSATTISASTGSVLLELLDHRGNPTDTVFEHSVVRVRATDPGGNLSPAGVDTVTVTAVARDTSGAIRDTETFDLEETGPNTGIFLGEVPIWGAPGPVAENGTLENWHTGSGAPDTVIVTYGPASVSGAVLPGRIWFADAAGNPVTQFSLGSRMYIFAEGDNYNVHPSPSTVDYIPYVTVRLDSGPYLYIELYETGPDTGLFAGYVNTGPGSTYPNLHPQVGEEVEAKVVYAEPFPFSARATIGPNLPPVAVDDAVTVSEENTEWTSVLSNDSDPENERLTLDSITVPPLHGTAWIESGERVVYHPETDFNGTDTLRYRVSDLSGNTAEATVTYTVVATNDPPVVGNGLIIDVVEDTPRTFTIPVSDAEGETTTLVWLVPPADGTLAVNPDGSFTYTPAPNANGDRTFTVRYQDTSGATSDGTSTLRIAAVNDPPVAVDDSHTMPEDYYTLLTVTTNDTDADGEPLVITQVTQPAHGTASGGGGSATILYTPTANYNGQDSFTYTLTDASGASSTATVRITLISVPDLPVAVADSAVTPEDTPVSISVLANDSDGDGDVLTITYDGTQPSHGVVMFGDPGILIYRPVINYSGPDSFIYVISDGHGGTATATVSLTVTPVNDPPVAVNDILAIDEDTVGTLAVLANDSDVENDTLTITAVTQGAHGTAVIRPGTPRMTLEYTPVANYAGSDVLTYTISDGHGGTATATVNLVVRQIPDPPVAVADTATTSEDAAVTINVLANDSDPDNNTLSVAGLLTLPAHGTAVRNPNNTITYTPAANYNGSDSFTYNLADGTGRFAVGTVQVAVQPVNDPPAAASDSASTPEDTATAVSVLANDSDPDGDSLSVTAVTQPDHGSTAFTPSGVTYAPAANYNGPDSFTYTISDGNGGSATATVSVTVNPVNDLPAAANDSASTVEDTATTVSVLANDSDPEGDSLSVTAVTQPDHGAATFTPSGVAYTPAADYNGADSFSYTIFDGNGGNATAMVSVTVTAVNDSPVATNDSASTAEDTTTTVSVLANDSDPDGDSLTVTAATQPAHGAATYSTSAVTYTPAANYNGPDSFTYTVSDGNGGTATATVSVNVNASNDSPVAGGDSTSTAEDTAKTISVLLNDSDLDGDLLTVTAVTQPAHGSAAFTPSGVTYTPAADYNGADSFSYTISDGNGGNATAMVSVTITAVNDSPMAVNDSASTLEDTATTVGVLANDSDSDGDSLSVTAVTQPAHGSAAYSASAVTYTPAANYNGPDSFSYTISDGNGGTATASVSVTVTPSNDPPVASGDSTSTAEDTAKTISVLLNDSDLDGDSLAVTAVTQPAHGSAAYSASAVTYTPAANYNGPDSFTYTASDGNGGSATATVSVTITPSNDPPVASGDSTSTAEDTAKTISVLLNDSDIDGDSLAVTAVTQPTHGVAAFTTSGVTYTPAANYNGADAFTYTIADGHGGSATGAVSVSVTPVNDPPNAAGDSAVTREGVGVSVAVLVNDSDIEGNPLTVTGVSTPAKGTATFTASAVTYSPGVNFNGTDSFTYTVSDGAATATGTVTVTVKDALERVAVLATNSVSILTGADVLSGDVVVNQAGSGPFLGGVELSLAGTVTTPSGWDVEGNRVTVAAGANVAGDVFSNQLANSGTITGQQVSTLALPVFSSLPPLLAATPNTTDVSVNANGSRTLAPGTYRDLTVGKKGTVIFTGGTYHFRSITTDTQAKLLFSAASTVRVQQKLSVKATSTVGPNTGSSINASAIVFHVAGINGTGGGLAETPKAVEIGTDNILTANVYAPNGTLLIGDRTQAGGSFFGKDVQVGPDVQVTLQTAWGGQ